VVDFRQARGCSGAGACPRARRTVRTPNGEVIITPNGQIVQLTNLSRDWARAVVDVPVPLSVDVVEGQAMLAAAQTEAARNGHLLIVLQHGVLHAFQKASTASFRCFRKISTLTRTGS
jgi:small-conductance mechanosensitive channel